MKLVYELSEQDRECLKNLLEVLIENINEQNEDSIVFYNTYYNSLVRAGRLYNNYIEDIYKYESKKYLANPELIKRLKDLFTDKEFRNDIIKSYKHDYRRNTYIFTENINYVWDIEDIINDIKKALELNDLYMGEATHNQSAYFYDFEGKYFRLGWYIPKLIKHLELELKFIYDEKKEVDVEIDKFMALVKEINKEDS